MRENKNNNKLIISKLCIIILEAIKSMIQDYTFLYNDKELKLLKNMLDRIISNQTLDTINYVEKELKKLAFRTWKYEEKQENYFIHWLKNNDLNTKSPIISSTFGEVDPFCNSVIGIRYKTNINGFLGACEKDASVVIEESNQKSIYTIKELNDGRVVNSYNLGTPIITPKLAMNTSNNNYKSKHNEIILDANIAVPIEVICNDENYIDLAIKISKKYKIPYHQEKNKSK